MYPIQIIVQTGWQICDPLRHEDRLVKVNIPFNILFREGRGFDPMKLSGGRTSGLRTNWFEWSHAPILSKKSMWLCLQCWRQQVLLLSLKVLGWAPHFLYNFLVLMFCYSHIYIYTYIYISDIVKITTGVSYTCKFKIWAPASPSYFLCSILAPASHTVITGLPA